MAVTYTQAPTQKFDMAYGPNPITLTGIGLADKYVLQILKNGTIIADVRQTPNRVGKAIFDIQNILQNQVATSKPDIETTGFTGDHMAPAINETANYAIWVGSETAGVSIIDTQYNADWVVIGGTKQYYQEDFDSTPYVPQLSNSGGQPVVTQRAQPFTDRRQYKLGSQITDKPVWVTNNMKVYEWEVTQQDMTTMSFYNGVDGTPPLMVKGVGAFRVSQWNGSQSNGTFVYDNIQSLGGGPNLAIGDGTTVAYPYNAITFGTGPANYQDLDPLTTHYYVATNAYDSLSVGNANIAPLHEVHRFNIVPAACNDFEHIQFSWLNSFGFRDYYTFRKKNTRGVNVKRNEYLKEAADYSSNSYNVNTYNRGMTTYSQMLEETYSAFTDFMSDDMAKFLQGLFTAADAKVRIGNETEWKPISIQSSSWIEKTNRTDKLFQYDIKFKLAHNLKSQRG